MGAFDKQIAQVQFWDERLTKAGTRHGLRPYRTIYELVNDVQMMRLIPYTMMPAHYGHWSFGKKYEQWRKQGGFHIFEAVINSDPSFCYLGVTNVPLMQVLVMAHATWGHVDFFAQNKLFAETQPGSLLHRMAQHKEFIKRLVQDPTFGWEKVEWILDAAHAVDEYVGWLPTVSDRVSDDDERKSLESRLVELQLKLPRLVSEFEKEGIKAEIASLEALLKVQPLHPSDDIVGFVMDPKHNSRLGEEARGLLAIVRDEARYFQPQGRTKIMNEGWASIWEKALLEDPEVNMPFEWRLDAARYWSMHESVVTNMYFDPYALGLAVWEYIDRTYGFDEKATEVEVDDGQWHVLADTDKEDVEAQAARLATVAAANGHSWFEADSNVFWEGYGQTKKVKVVKRNRDRMLEVRRNFEDSSFLRTFLTDELFEHLNLRALEWVRRVMEMINRLLARQGWDVKLVVEPLPNDLEGLMEVVQAWLNAAEQSEMMRSDLGTPVFPVPEQTLKTMATVLQIVAAFDEDKAKAKQMLIARSGYSSIPVIHVADSGIYGDGSLTLRHVFDETFGPLLQSECRDTVRYVRRLWGRPVRLLTKELKTDRWGRPDGDPLPYEYYCDEDGEVKERWLE